MRTEDLIGRLSAELQPVRPLPSPGRRALLWLAVAGGVLSGFILVFGPRPDLLEDLRSLPALLEWAGAVLTGVLAAVAAFHLALPDRSSRWLLLPMPAALLWLSGLGMGCVGELLQAGPGGPRLGTSFSCLAFIVGTSVPLGGLLLVMLRHAGPIRPRAVTLLAALASAALCSAALSVFHHLDSALMVVLWHVVPITVFVALTTLAAPRLFDGGRRELPAGGR